VISCWIIGLKRSSKLSCVCGALARSYSRRELRGPEVLRQAQDALCHPQRFFGMALAVELLGTARAAGARSRAMRQSARRLLRVQPSLELPIVRSGGNGQASPAAAARRWHSVVDRAIDRPAANLRMLKPRSN
jgi:hypothetical protein